MIKSETASLLQQLAVQYETKSFLKNDPSRFMHEVKGNLNRETSAFIASCFSYGNRQQFMPKIAKLLESCNKETYRWVIERGYVDTLPDVTSCFYRFQSFQDVRKMLDILRKMYMEYKSIGSFIDKYCSTGLQVVSSLCQYFSINGGSTLIPHDTRSSCKRLCMFMRWMVRNNSVVDLGLWKNIIDKRTLIMPIDTHVLQESRKLDLISSKVPSMSIALRLTKDMLEVFPDDPLLGDFALFGLGINSSEAL